MKWTFFWSFLNSKWILQCFRIIYVCAKPICMVSRTHAVYKQQSADIGFSCSFIYSSLMVLLLLTRPMCVRHICFELVSGSKMAGDFLQASGRDLMENILKLVGDSWNELSKAEEKNQWTTMNSKKINKNLMQTFLYVSTKQNKNIW